MPKRFTVLTFPITYQQKKWYHRSGPGELRYCQSVISTGHWKRKRKNWPQKSWVLLIVATCFHVKFNIYMAIVSWHSSAAASVWQTRCKKKKQCLVKDLNIVGVSFSNRTNCPNCLKDPTCTVSALVFSIKWSTKICLSTMVQVLLWLNSHP